MLISNELISCKNSAEAAGNFLISYESVGKGHPDKIADQISDCILDVYLQNNKNARVAVEVVVKGNSVYIYGECSEDIVDFADVELSIRKVIANHIGYNKPIYGFDAESCEIHFLISSQAKRLQEATLDYGLHKNINLQGAGDQGVIFGYACDEADNLMPIGVNFAHAIVRNLNVFMFNNPNSGLRPDNKAQITLEYDHQFNLIQAAVIVVAQQHDESVTQNNLSALVKDICCKSLPSGIITSKTIFIVNGQGDFVIGGPIADTGLTGRKIIVDTYGGVSRHGGGAFSGKDPSKVDRSAAYMARYISKQIVFNNLAKKVELQLSYSLGIAEPISIYINSFGTANGLNDSDLIKIIRGKYDLRPASIIDFLELKTTTYLPTACYGHFGRNDFSWETIDASF